MKATDVLMPEVQPVTAADILRRARAMLGPNGENWTQGTFARSADGEDIDNPVHPQAARWCAWGAFSAAAVDAGSDNEAAVMKAQAALKAAARSTHPGLNVVRYNDAVSSRWWRACSRRRSPACPELTAWPGAVRLGLARPGKDFLAWLGAAWYGLAMLGTAWQGLRGRAWRGLARQGKCWVRLGMA